MRLIKKHVFVILLMAICFPAYSAENDKTSETKTTLVDNENTEIAHLNKLVEQIGVPHKNISDRIECNNAAKELINLGPKTAPIIPDLIQLLVTEEDTATYTTISNVLVKLDQLSVEPLINELKNTNGKYISSAIGMLGVIKDHRSVDPIIPFLSNKDPKIRKSAFWAVYNMPDARAYDFLVNALNDGDAEVRKYAVYALGKIRDPRAAERIRQVFLKDTDIKVKEAGAYALGRLKYTPATDELIMAIPDLTVSYYCGLTEYIIYALEEIGDPKAREPLTRILLNKSADRISRIDAAHALGKLIPDAQTVDALVKVWNDSDVEWEIRTAAAMALGYTRDPRANDALRFAIEPDYPNTITTKAIELLGEGGDIERYHILKEFSKTTKHVENRLYAEYILKTRYKSEEGLDPED